MKYLANILRVFVGLLFIFSGFIKSNDPTGFSYKLDEYFSVFSGDVEAIQDSIEINITANGETVSSTHAISPNRNEYQIIANSSPWISKPIMDGITDSVHFADATLSLGSKQLFTSSINSQMNDSVLLDATITYGIAGNLLGEETISFLASSENNRIINIDASKYVKENSWLVDFFQGLRPYALALAIFLCVLEIVLGIALIIGWAPKFTIWLLIIIIILFTFLTGYSAYFNKVTDCGCFGDAIKLTPWESFNKDIILSVSILLILLGIKYVKPIFSNPFSVKVLTTFTILSVSFSLYCWHYLPVKNFLKFKEGNNIMNLTVVPEGAPTDVYENVFVYAKDGVEEEFSLEQMSGRDLKEEGYSFVDRRDKLISKGYDPEIHDFKIMDESRSNDYIDDFFADSSYKILIVMNDVEKVNLKSIDELKKIIKMCQKEGFEIYPLTASASEKVDSFRHEHQFDIPFYYGDKTNLKSIIRSNPGLVLFDGNVVKRNWPSTRLPSVKKFMKAVAK
ncbi:MAG: hypothetical protein COA58_06740 [Bacteroidetes bacterium]|nr:MAG: hypothetical protein COA58_06740 [Bacteroidota bacterium]